MQVLQEGTDRDRSRSLRVKPESPEGGAQDEREEEGLSGSAAVVRSFDKSVHLGGRSAQLGSDDENRQVVA